MNPEDVTTGKTNRDSGFNSPRIVLQMALCHCSEAGCISGIAFVRIGNLGKIRGLEKQSSRMRRFAVERIVCVRTRAESREMIAATFDAPQQWVENITEQERADLAALAELSEQLSLVRKEALQLLG